MNSTHIAIPRLWRTMVLVAVLIWDFYDSILVTIKYTSL